MCHTVHARSFVHAGLLLLRAWRPPHGQILHWASALRLGSVLCHAFCVDHAGADAAGAASNLNWETAPFLPQPD